MCPSAPARPRPHTPSPAPLCSISPVQDFKSCVTKKAGEGRGVGGVVSTPYYCQWRTDATLCAAQLSRKGSVPPSNVCASVCDDPKPCTARAANSYLFRDRPLLWRKHPPSHSHCVLCAPGVCTGRSTRTAYPNGTAATSGGKRSLRRARSRSRVAAAWTVSRSRWGAKVENASPHSKRSGALSSWVLELSFGYVSDPSLVRTVCEGERQTRPNDCHSSL